MKQTTKYSLAAILVLGLGCAVLTTVVFLIRRNSCATEVVRVQDISGVRFEVEDSTCDVIAHNEAVSVYAKKTAQSQSWFSPNWRARRTLLFRYDPGRWDNPLPSITIPSQSVILISIPEISSILYQNRRWDNMSITYEIGKVYYPTKSK